MISRLARLSLPLDQAIGTSARAYATTPSSKGGKAPAKNAGSRQKVAQASTRGSRGEQGTGDARIDTIRKVSLSPARFERRGAYSRNRFYSSRIRRTRCVWRRSPRSCPRRKCTRRSPERGRCIYDILEKRTNPISPKNINRCALRWTISNRPTRSCSNWRSEGRNFRMSIRTKLRMRGWMD